MIQEGRISNLHLAAIVAVVILSKALNPFFVILVHYGHSAAGLLGMLSATIMFLFVLPLFVAAKTNHSFVGLAKINLGNFLGTLIGASSLVLLYLDACVSMRADIEQVQLVFLPQTPPTVIDYVFLIFMLFGAYMGLEVIARATLITYTVVVTTILILTILTTSQWDTTSFFPPLGPGIGTLAKQGVLHAGYFGEIILFFMLRPFLRTYAQFKRGLLWGYGTAVSMVVVGLYITQFMLPYPTDDHLYYLFIEVGKLLYFGRFFQHIEAIFALSWLPVSLLRMTIFLFVICLQLAELCNTTNYRRFLLPTGFLIYLGSFVPPSLEAAIDFKDIWLQQRTFPLYGGFALLVGIVSLIRKRHKQADQGSAEKKSDQSPRRGGRKRARFA
ncbi:GerAB/ArcD/ProY family transporter [Ferroacidibacillus organovorans]|uniref:Uncharacterized protein n=1 Tax=Ferroacidibacillus organovorans TaxID=1765683 RepID=A0A853KBA0_9BACL|nr:GerAB/ArcD/ProY family transporter [Ferroacidibacillus organovorans]KYP81049.1 hypothetical protein AYJ22_08950 [Ferroacidibacillus organovorans]OAG93678.1 hypothetical protein AYW79_09215 [Ferroacidibacillus organovorans]